jgi:hypothetical protein
MEEQQLFEVVDYEAPKIEASKFSIELNTALGIGFEYSKKYANDPDNEKKNVMTWVDGQKIFRSETIVKSHMGPPGSLEQDVLLVLMTLCLEEVKRSNKEIIKTGKIKVYFTYADLCRRLGVHRGSSKNIKKAIYKLSAQEVVFKDFVSDLSDFKSEEIRTRIISRSGSLKKGNIAETKQEFDGRHWVELDVRIVASLQDGLYSTMDRDIYLSLKKGAVRRLYQIICARRRVEGNTFVLFTTELGDNLGLRDKKKVNYYLNKYFKELRDKISGFSYILKKIDKKSVAYVTFEESLIETNLEGTFYNELQKDYGQVALDLVEIEDFQVEALLREFGDKTVKFKSKEILLSEFCIDVALFQVMFCKYKLSSTFQSLVRSMYKSGYPMIPDEYRIFVRDRNAEKQKERIKQEIKEKVKREEDQRREQEDKLIVAAGDFKNKIREKNKKLYAELEKEAIDLIKKYDEEASQEEEVKKVDIEAYRLSNNLRLEQAITEVIKTRIKDGNLNESTCIQ